MHTHISKKATFISLAMASSVMLTLAGCSSGGDNPGNSGEAQSINLRLGHIFESSHPIETCFVATLNEELEGSGISVDSFPASQLGGEAEMLEQISTGSLDSAFAGSAYLSNWHAPTGVLEASYLFDDPAHLISTIGGELMQGVFEELTEVSGMRVHAGVYYGTRHVTANKQISTPEDLNGLKIRTPDAPVYLTNIQLMGGTGTPMALSEVYLALQQGVIDAQENPIPTIETAKLNEVQDYINLTGHQVQGTYLISQDSLTDSFSESQKAAFDAAVQAAGEATAECIIHDEQEILDRWKADGSINVNEDIDVEALAAAAREHYAADSTFGDLYTAIRNTK